MKVTPSKMNAERQQKKRIKRLYWERHWTFTRRKKQHQRIMAKYWCGKWCVRKWRSLIDGTLCTEDGEAIQSLMAFKERYTNDKRGNAENA